MSDQPCASPTVGIFVGGQGSRMGGRPKGLLAAPDGSGTLVSRLHQLCISVLPSCQVVLVGDHPAYRSVGLTTVADEPPGVGPMGGLRALLSTAAAQGTDAIALACDLPNVTADMLRRLVEHVPDAGAVAPRVDEVWQPLFARYRPELVYPVTTALLRQRRLGLHWIFDTESTSSELPLTQAERDLLGDWDTEDDVRAGSSHPPPRRP